MVLLRDIKGQDNAVRYLRNSLSSGRIANSYLFFGPEGVGRALTAKTFVMTLVCAGGSGQDEACGTCPSCRRVDNLDHPDVTWIKPAKNKNIKIEEIRKVKEVLNLKPYESSVNVCVIEDAHMMTVEASNALLKVLEEPPGRSLLILISSKKDMLLPTVVSRCAEVRFRSLPIKDTKEIVMNNSGADEETAYFLAYFSQGSPGRALEMTEEGLLEQKTSLIGLVERIVKERNSSCMNWDKEDKDHLLEDLELLIMFFRDIAFGKEGIEEMVLDKGLLDTETYRFFKMYPMEKLCGIVERLIRLKKALMGNVNPKLVAQVLPGCLK